jgi:ABC-type phosphate transport system auxiliary subunit
MSEFIDVISPKALEQLKLANAEIVTMVSNVKKVNENLIGAKTPSGSDSALKNLTAEYQKQEQAIVKVQKQLEKARLEEIRLQQAREKAFDKYDAQLSKEQAKLQASENLYNKNYLKSLLNLDFLKSNGDYLEKYSFIFDSVSYIPLEVKI